jgi:hypothetical protein
MLGGEEVIGGVVIAALGDALGNLLEPEAIGGRPEDRVGVVRMREVHDLAGWKSRRARRRARGGGNGENDQRAKHANRVTEMRKPGGTAAAAAGSSKHHSASGDRLRKTGLR